MRTVGIGKKLREAILLAEYEDIRYTATCKFWLHDAIDTAYETLVHLNDRLKQDAAWVDYKHKRGDRRKSLPPSLANPIMRYLKLLLVIATSSLRAYARSQPLQQPAPYDRRFPCTEGERVMR